MGSIPDTVVRLNTTNNSLHITRNRRVSPQCKAKRRSTSTEDERKISYGSVITEWSNLLDREHWKDQNDTRQKQLPKENHPQSSRSTRIKWNREVFQQERLTSESGNMEENTQIYSNVKYIPKLSDTMNRQLRAAAIPELIQSQMEHVSTQTKTMIPREGRTYKYGLQNRLQTKTPPWTVLHWWNRENTKKTQRRAQDRYAPGYRSSLIKHTVQYNGHEPDTDTIDIKNLDHKTNKFECKIMESSYMNLYGSKWSNYKRDANRLHIKYGNVLDIYKRTNAE